MMKKNRKTAIKYYALLLSGFLMLLPPLIFERLFPGSVDKHGALLICWVIVFFGGYLYALSRFSATKEVEQYFKESEKNSAMFRKKHKNQLKKIAKICVIADIPMTIITISLVIAYVVFGIERAIVHNPYLVVWVFFNIFLYLFIYVLKKDEQGK